MFRVNIDELLSTDSLPAPAKRGDAPKKEVSRKRVDWIETLSRCAQKKEVSQHDPEKTKTESLFQEAAPAPAAPKQRQVGIADQIAIRSYVLGKGLKSSE